MAELRDSPRPDTFWPGTPNQWREPTVDDCTWYATEFAFEAASNVHRSMHPVKDIRNHSSDTTGGTPVPVALRETARIWPDSDGVRYKYGAISKAEIRRALIDHKTIVWGGDYEKLPPHYRRWTNNDTFNHAMASRGFRNYQGVDQTFLYDPLGGGSTYQEYDGEWISLEALYRFSWGYPTENVGIVWGPGNTKQSGGIDGMIQGNFERTSQKYIELPIGVKVYDAPNGNVFRKITKATRYDYFGYSGAWWAVEVWHPEKGARVIGYIEKGDYERGNWPVVVEPNDELEEALQRIDELEGVLRAIEKMAEEAVPPTSPLIPLGGPWRIGDGDTLRPYPSWDDGEIVTTPYEWQTTLTNNTNDE